MMLELIYQIYTEDSEMSGVLKYKEKNISGEQEKAVETLVESIRNQKLSFFEESIAIEKLISCYGMTQEDAAEKLGKAQSTVANKLRLLRLTPEERDIIETYRLTERHARALLRLGSSSERLTVLEKIVEEKLNVEKTEILIDSYIGCEKQKNTYKKRSKVFHSVRNFMNTFNKAVENMKEAGVSACSRQVQNDEYIEYTVRIPLKDKDK